MTEPKKDLTFSDREDTIFHFVLNCHEYLSMPLRNYAKSKYGWTSLQFSCMAYIKRYQMITMSDLAELLFITRQQATQLVNTLVQRNLVEREYDPKNRRLVYVKPSALAIEELIEIEQRYIAIIEEHLASYPQDKQQKILKAMNEISDFALAVPLNAVKQKYESAWTKE